MSKRTNCNGVQLDTVLLADFCFLCSGVFHRWRIYYHIHLVNMAMAFCTTFQQDCYGYGYSGSATCLTPMLVSHVRVKGKASSKASRRRSRGSGAQKEQGSGKEPEPYRLRAVGHSLGGASLLIYAVSRCLQGQPTHLTRLILLTPAGFQQNYPKVHHRLLPGSASLLQQMCQSCSTYHGFDLYQYVGTCEQRSGIHSRKSSRCAT